MLTHLLGREVGNQTARTSVVVLGLNKLKIYVSRLSDGDNTRELKNGVILSISLCENFLIVYQVRSKNPACLILLIKKLAPT